MAAEAFMAAYSTRCVSKRARENTEDVSESARTVLRIFSVKTAVHNKNNNTNTYF